MLKRFLLKNQAWTAFFCYFFIRYYRFWLCIFTVFVTQAVNYASLRIIAIVTPVLFKSLSVLYLNYLFLAHLQKLSSICRKLRSDGVLCVLTNQLCKQF